MYVAQLITISRARAEPATHGLTVQSDAVADTDDIEAGMAAGTAATNANAKAIAGA